MDETKKGLLSLGGLIALGALIVAATRPAKEATITGLWHSPDGVTWEGLRGATLDAGPIVFGVSYKNNSSVPLGLRLDFSVDEQQDSWSSIVAPNEELMVSFNFALSEGGYTAIAILYEEETMQELDRKSATFTVVSPAPPVPAPRGHILAFLVQLNGTWQNIAGMELEVDLGVTVPVAVSWANDFLPGGNSVRGQVTLTVTRPDGTSVTPSAVSGQNAIVAANASNFVTFNVQLPQAGGYTLNAILKGETVA